MYNGIGLATPRGSGTNGYVVKNLSVVSQRPRPGENSTAVVDTSDMLPFRKPDESILLHEKKRQIEIQCLEMQLKLEDEDKLSLGDDEIIKRVDQLRESLLIKLSAGKEIVDRRIKCVPAHDSHQVAKAKQDENSRMMKALGISEATYVEGAAFDRERIETEKLIKANEREIFKAKLLQKQKAVNSNSGSESDSSVSLPQQTRRKREKVSLKDSTSDRYRRRKLDSKDSRETSPKNFKHNRAHRSKGRDRSSQNRREVHDKNHNKKNSLPIVTPSSPLINNARHEGISTKQFFQGQKRSVSRSDGEASVSPNRVHFSSGATLKRGRTSRSPKNHSHHSISRSPLRLGRRRHSRSPIREKTRNNSRSPLPSEYRQSNKIDRNRRRSISSSSSKTTSRSLSPTLGKFDKGSSRPHRHSSSRSPLTKSTNTRSPLLSHKPFEARAQNYSRRRSPQLKRRSMSRSPRSRRRSISPRSTSASRSPIRTRRRSISRSSIQADRRSVSPSSIRTKRRSISRSPIRNRHRSISRSPIRTRRRSISRSPIRNRHRSISRSPIRTRHRSISRSPIRTRRRSISRSSIRTRRRSISRSPIRTRRRSISRSPIRNRHRSISRSPIRNRRRSVSRSPIHNLRRSTSRSPSVSKSRSVSRSPTNDRKEGVLSPLATAGHSKGFSRSPEPKEEPRKGRFSRSPRRSDTCRINDRSFSRSHKSIATTTLISRRGLSNSRSPISRYPRGRSVSSVSNRSSGSSSSYSSSLSRSQK